MNLINKDVLVAEIDKRLHQLTDAAFDSMIGRNLIEIKDFLDTHEVKEVDLEKEVNEVFFKRTLKEADKLTHKQLMVIAKHFFELGLKAAQKGE